MSPAAAKLRIGTRGSALALAQSRWTAAELARLVGYEPELVIVKTSGDRFQAQSLASFLERLAQARRRGELSIVRRLTFDDGAHAPASRPVCFGIVRVPRPARQCLPAAAAFPPRR